MSDTSGNADELVYIVDDEPAVLQALARQLRSHGWLVEVFSSAEAFLEHPKSSAVACLVLDVSLPGLDGIELQSQLRKKHESIPIIFLTGFGDIPMSVRAMRAGAADFLTKPVSAAHLCEAIRQAIDKEAAARGARKQIELIFQAFERLTLREKEVFERIADGKLNKQIAAELGIVEQTVKFHRARILERMQARTTAELMRMAAQLNIGRNM